MTKDLENHKNVLVIGGGVTGIQATKDLAERGYQVYLVEKEPNLGGKLVQLDETFPVSAVSDSCSLCYPLCYMLPELSTLYLKKNIKVLTYSTVKNIEEKKGKYNVLINSKSRFIDVEKCNGCAKCIEVCPVKEIPDEFNFNISKRTAIYQPLPGSITPQHLIDQKNCKNFIDGSCKKCAEICPQKAINFKLKDKEMKINVDSIIVATGFDQIDPSIVPRYGSKYQNVVTSLQFERLNSINGPTKGQVLRLSNNKAPKSIAFIQCVCSREKDTPGCVSYCSTVCCMYAAKEALTIRKKKLPEAKCSIFNTEQRGYGKQYYDMMIDAKHNYDVNFINGRVGKIKENPESNNLVVYYENINTGEFSTEEYEMVVLASGLTKSKGKERISQMLGSLLDEDGLFPDTELEKLEKRSIYIAGFARYPMNIPDSVSDGSSVAAKIAEKLPLPLLKYEPDEEVEKEKQKTASQIAQQTPKIGVIYCEFQSKISSIINFEKIIKEINGIPDIISQEIIHNAFSKEGRKKIQDIIQKSKINRIVFSAGSPRYYEEYFKELLKEIKFNPSLMDIVDIREQNAYVHQNDPDGAIQKATDLIKLSIAKVRNYQPLITVKGSVIQSVLVIGSEISGIIAASSLAKQGIDVHLLETTLENLSNSFEFDKISHSAQISNSQLKDIVKNYKNNKDITIHSNIKLVKSSGFAGNYSISLEDVNTKEIKEMKFGAIIVAGGTKQHPPANGQFEYGVNNSVMTQ
ncbi:MAG: FAD-dependent oxidoreductase, partial [archaeon]|nr:FAD-dependent oxidoreductase [archaeon]